MQVYRNPFQTKRISDGIIVVMNIFKRILGGKEQEISKILDETEKQSIELIAKFQTFLTEAERRPRSNSLPTLKRNKEEVLE